jgi:prevent-host-death family protein
MVMKSMPAGKFKAECLKLMDEVESSQEPLLITKRGRPVVKLVPALPKQASKDFLGCLRGIVDIVGDIESPLEPPDAWKALR